MMHLLVQHRLTLPGRHWAVCARHSRFIATTVLLLTAAACSKDSPTKPATAGPPAKVAIVSGDAQSGVVGQELASPLVVRVVDANGTPVQGQEINFHVTAGGGSVFAGSSNSNADGVAQERWTPGTVAGADQTVEARAVDNSTGAGIVFATFHATAVPDAPAALSILTQPAATAQSGIPFPTQPRIEIVDRYGNAVKQSNIRVTASISAPTPKQELVGDANAATDPTGVAAFTDLAVRSPEGNATFTFVSGSLTPAISSLVTIRAGTAATLEAAGPRTVTNTVTTPLVNTLPRVVVKDSSGNPVAGVPVLFSLSAGGGTIAPTSTTTDGSGQAGLTSWTLPSVAGTYYVVASSPPIAGASIQFTGIAKALGAATMTMVSGDAQSAQVAQLLPQPLVVQLLDIYGNHVDSAAVQWSTINGTVATLAGETTLTGPDGRGSNTVTMPQASGGVVIQASASGGLKAVFNETSNPGPLAKVLKHGGDGQAGVIATVAPVPLVIAAVDQYGNGIAGIAVSWSATGGAMIAPTQSTTGFSGLATTSLTFGATAGTETVTATVQGFPLISFTETAVTQIGGWTLMAIPTTNVLRDIWGTSPSDVFAVGDNGTILHFNGSSWSTMPSGTTANITSVWGASSSEVYASVGSGTAPILRYDGTSWSPLILPPPPARASMRVASATAAIALYPTNGGTDTAYAWTGTTWAVVGTGQYLNQTWLGVDGRGAFSDYTTEPGIANDGTGWKSSDYFGFRVMAMTGKSFDALFVQKSGLSTCCQLSAPGWGTTPMGSPLASLTPVWMVSPSEVYLRSGTKLERARTPYDTQPVDEGIDAVAMWGSSSIDLFIVGADGKIYHRAQ